MNLMIRNKTLTTTHTTKNKITEGVLWQQILLFFIPIIMSAFFQHFYVMVDTMIVGKYLGEIELAAVGGSSSKLIVLLINFFVGVSSGITAYVSRYFGGQNLSSLKNTILNGVFLFTVLTCLLCGLGIYFSMDLLIAMATPIETLSLAHVYLVTYLTGLIFCVLYNVFSGILRALGDAKSPLYVLIIASILNITLDLVLIIFLDLGVFGAALATLIAQAISAIALVYILRNKLPKTEEKAHLSITNIKEIAFLGLPAGLQSIMYSLSNIAIQKGVNSVSTIAVASWVAYVKLDGIVDIFVSSLGATVITFVGQNLGAGYYDRVKKAVLQTIGLAYIITSFLVAFFLILRKPMLSLFTNEAQVVEIGAQLMLIIMPMYLLTIPYQMFSQALRGLGKSIIPMFITLFGVVGLRFFWVYFIFPYNHSILLLAACYPVSALLMSLIFTVYYRFEIKKLGI